jgi:hypothetical protein
MHTRWTWSGLTLISMISHPSGPAHQVTPKYTYVKRDPVAARPRSIDTEFHRVSSGRKVSFCRHLFGNG